MARHRLMCEISSNWHRIKQGAYGQGCGHRPVHRTRDRPLRPLGPENYWSFGDHLHDHSLESSPSENRALNSAHRVRSAATKHPCQGCTLALILTATQVRPQNRVRELPTWSQNSQAVDGCVLAPKPPLRPFGRVPRLPGHTLSVSWNTRGILGARVSSGQISKDSARGRAGGSQNSPMSGLR